MKSTYWSIEVLHPATNTTIETKQFDNILDISKHYKNIPLSTWRNMAIGRCKIYKKFIKICKKKHEVILSNTTQTEN